MLVNLRVAEGDWGGATPADVAELGHEVLQTFSIGLEASNKFAIVLERNQQPMALCAPSDRGEFVIHLSCEGTRWNQFAFQLAHEFCHVLVGPQTWCVDEFSWLEESICDAASLFALRSLALKWSGSQRWHWQQYYMHHWSYCAEYLAHPNRSLPSGCDFLTWFRVVRPLLEFDYVRRDMNTVVARHLLPVFERAPVAWQAMRYFRSFDRIQSMGLRMFFKRWAAACPPEVRFAVHEMAAIFDIKMPADTSRNQVA